MGALGLNPELMDGLLDRLSSTGSRGMLQTAVRSLSTAVAKTQNPQGYGLVAGQDSVLTAPSVPQAAAAVGLVRSALTSLNALADVLRGDVAAQRTTSTATSWISGGLTAFNTLGDLRPRPLVWEYRTRAGVHYGPLLGRPDNPRRNWTNNRLRIRDAAYFTGRNPTGTDWIRNDTARNRLDATNRFITRIADAIPPRILRVAGPVGTILDAGITYHGAYNEQLAADVDAGYSESEASQRARTSATAQTVGSVAGGVVGGAVGAAAGAAVAGPVGAIVGGMIGSVVGGWVGETVGGWIGGWLNG